MKESKLKNNIRVPGWIKNIIVIIISGAILFYYFHKFNWLDILIALKRSNFVLAIFSMLIPQLFFWYTEVYITKLLINWFHGDFSFKKYFWVRGAIYFLIMINSSIGLGGIVFYIKQKTKMSWSKLLGIIFFRYILTIWGFCFLLIPVGIFMKVYLSDSYGGLNLNIWWAVLSSMFVLMVGTWIYWHNKTRFNRPILKKKSDSEFWEAFRMATDKQWLTIWLIGLSPYILYLAGIYFQTVAFGMRIPIFRYIVLSPIAIIVADLPIAFSGFGTTTVSFMTFFGNYGLPESIAAFSLFFPFSRAVIRALIGIVSIKPASQELEAILKRRK